MGKNLTRLERETLAHLDTLTVKQIASRRGKSCASVYKIIKNIQKKGVEINRLKMGGTSVLSRNFQPFSASYIRLHGMQFSVMLISDSSFYHKVRKRGDWVVVDGNKVRLNISSLDVYQDSDSSFYGVDEDVATADAFDYWNKFFLKLENRFKVILVKDQYQNVRLVKHHYARINDGVAKHCNERRKRIEIFSADGKLRFTIDNSLGFNEAETQHIDSAKPDISHYTKQINDWLVYNPPTNSELAGHIKSLVEDRQYYAENLRSHVDAIKKLGDGVDRLTSLVKPRLPTILELCEEFDWVHHAFMSLDNKERLKRGFGLE